jgi:hypothetical protein
VVVVVVAVVVVVVVVGCGCRWVRGWVGVGVGVGCRGGVCGVCGVWGGGDDAAVDLMAARAALALVQCLVATALHSPRGLLLVDNQLTGSIPSTLGSLTALK